MFCAFTYKLAQHLLQGMYFHPQFTDEEIEISTVKCLAQGSILESGETEL
jgi:hypothetical protein